MYHLNRIVVFFILVLIGAVILPETVIAASDSQSSIEQTFQKAKKDYLDKDLKAAAQQIQKASDYMKAQAEKASVTGKEALAASARELNKLSEDVKKGTIKSVEKLDEAFARAYHAMAAESHAKSMEAWAKKQTVKAGNDLDSATKDLERGMAWTGQKIEKGTKDVIKKSEELALKLKKKSSVMADEVGNGLKKTGDEIEKFGKRISSK